MMYASRRGAISFDWLFSRKGIKTSRHFMLVIIKFSDVLINVSRKYVIGIKKEAALLRQLPLYIIES